MGKSNKSRIKQPLAEGKGKVGTGEQILYEFPVLSFAYFNEGDYGYNMPCSSWPTFIKNLAKYRDVSWHTLNGSHRKGLGYEKITIDKKLQTTLNLPPDYAKDFILSTRANGANRILFVRNREKMEVLAFDHELSLYSHG